MEKFDRGLGAEPPGIKGQSRKGSRGQVVLLGLTQRYLKFTSLKVASFEHFRSDSSPETGDTRTCTLSHEHTPSVLPRIACMLKNTGDARHPKILYSKQKSVSLPGRLPINRSISE